jgi:GT2 family glycosyltransferase
LIKRDGDFRVVVRENQPRATRVLPPSVEVIQNRVARGFGANHNATFRATGMTGDAWFVVCNPDIQTDQDQVAGLLDRAERDDADIAVPLLLTAPRGEFDHNVRPFPRIPTLARSFFSGGTAARYSSSSISSIRRPDWASGAFLAIRARFYAEIGGFDERYFMYMEDVDLCLRAARLGVPVHFYPDIRIVHAASRASRKIISRHFVWHIVSASRFFWRWKRSI